MFLAHKSTECVMERRKISKNKDLTPSRGRRSVHVQHHNRQYGREDYGAQRGGGCRVQDRGVRRREITAQWRFSRADPGLLEGNDRVKAF